MADASYLFPEGMRAKRPDWWVDGLLPKERERLRLSPRVNAQFVAKLSPGDAWKMVHLLDTLLEDRLQAEVDRVEMEVVRG